MKTFLALLLLCSLLVVMAATEDDLGCGDVSKENMVISTALCDACEGLFDEARIGELCRSNCFQNSYFEGCFDSLNLR
uniref:U50-Sparatoxin-Hju1a_1 n=1 Tax=Heteropoda jugulans TaxID=1358901 RepID=A0A4Q8KCL1_9ARAC